jgi:transposase-like protein
MSLSIPTQCANPECRRTVIREIHSYSEPVAIDAFDGPAVMARQATYRCAECGHTWAVRGYTSDRGSLPARAEGGTVRRPLTNRRGW